jgi:hypothetical protein
LIWGWPEVLSLAVIVQILNRGAWLELFSVSLWLVHVHEWDEAFSFSSKFSVLRYIEENETERGGKPRAQVEGSQAKFICIKGLKIPPQGRTIATYTAVFLASYTGRQGVR